MSHRLPMRMAPRGPALWLAFAALALPVHAAEPTAIAVEYQRARDGHYLLSVDPGERAALDAGTAWRRTGGQFGVFAAAGDAPGTVPVCQFSGDGGAGPGSRYLAAGDSPCLSLMGQPGLADQGIAFHAYPASEGTCPPGAEPVYGSDNNGAARGEGNPRYTVDATAQARMVASGHRGDGVILCAPVSAADAQADAVRLLRQATFGPTEADLARVAALGPSAWIDEQLALPARAYPDYPWVPANRPATCVDDRTLPVRPDSYCARDNYSLHPLQRDFFVDALTQPDQLRARVAFALSQILVTSGVSNGRNYAMRGYQQLLRDRALGNFEDLLAAVTLSPVMGDYLDMANNNKANAATGTNPNENYAREILQLFSIGLVRLNADGTEQLDAAGKPIPTYDLDEIEGFARVFTGWTYPPVAGAPSRGNNPRNYLGSLVPVPANHEFGTKRLLDGVVAPANLPMQDDLAFALRNIFLHPNVGPFIGRQLIQKLVTSDPTPGYVSRVAAAFADNGAGVRGDLRALVRAILLDPEARGARKIDPAYGKLAEPVLYMTALARALGGRTDGVYFRNASSALGQFVFYPASVFNYYPPDYVVPGTPLLGPEFAIQTTSTAIARANVANALIFSARIAPDASVYGATGTALDLAPWQAVAGNATALADRLDRLLLAGRMGAAMKAAIVGAVNALPPTDTLGRARTAAYLAVTSPQFQVER